MPATSPSRSIQLELDAALERISDGFMILDREWRYQYVNRAAEEYIGMPREQLLGQVLWELFPGAVGSDLEREFRRAAAGTEPVEVEFLGPVKKRWVSVRLFPSGVGLSIILRDITERRLAGERLRESEARYRSVFEHSIAAIFLTAPTGEILAANPAACQMVQRTEEEICRLGRGSVVDSSDPRTRAFLEERRRTGSARAELAMLRQDGTKFEVDVSSNVFIDGAGNQRTSIVAIDITERKRAEDSLWLLAAVGGVLQESVDPDERLRALITLLVPRLADVCLVDRVDDTRLKRVSSRERSGEDRDLVLQPLTPDSAVGIGAVLTSGRSQLVPEVTEAWLRDAARDADDLRAARALGARSALLVPMLLHGVVRGVLTLIHTTARRPFDASDQFLVEALASRAAVAVENARLFAAAVEARKLRDDVLAMVSHDLRAPLNAILLNAGMLAKKGDNDELIRIRRAATRANQLIEDLLMVAVIETGALPLVREREPVATVVEEVVQLHRPMAETAHVLLETDVERGCPDVWVDRHHLNKALSNLVGNAVKFTGAGGRVSVRAQRAGGVVQISVADTGAGISPDELEHVFDRFWQGKHAHRAGAGLGLAIARGCVEAHGGTIDVASQLGRGSTFTVTIPAMIDSELVS